MKHAAVAINRADTKLLWLGSCMEAMKIFPFLSFHSLVDHHDCDLEFDRSCLRSTDNIAFCPSLINKTKICDYMEYIWVIRLSLLLLAST